MPEPQIRGFFIVWAGSALYGLLCIPVDFFVTLKSHTIGFVMAGLLAFRSAVLIMLVVVIFAMFVFFLLKMIDRIRPGLLVLPLQQAVILAAGGFVIIFFLLFDNFYNKSEALLVSEIIGGPVVLMMVVILYRLLRVKDRAHRLATASPRVSIFGTFTMVILFGISFVGSKSPHIIQTAADKRKISNQPNIMLIVMDTVRADRLSLYGYQRTTTPFLDLMAKESAVFNNAFAVSPWTLPSHASLFTGLYPDQHKTHAEHFWLDNRYRTLAEILHDNGYQTISFSNNDYVSSYHNLTQGFERSWYKGEWTDNFVISGSNLGQSVVSFCKWFWKPIQTHFLAKIIKNPTALLDYPNAAVTNKALIKWFDNERDNHRPFFIFINYMDVHLPYNPSDEIARLFLDERELKISYKPELRFPPIEYCLDLSKSEYTERDIRLISTLYDASIRSLDNELKKLFNKIKKRGYYNKTLIMITSDHGEYLGTRNRLAHGLGLHKELLHIPLLARYPGLFKAGARYNTMVTHIDIPETILSFAKINERQKGMPQTQVLYHLKKNFRPNVFAEFRFPLHLLINSKLRKDNSNLFVEQKTIRNQRHQLIWKSRGDPEYYDLEKDPMQVNNLYSAENKNAQIMMKQLLAWFNAIAYPAPLPSEGIDSSKMEHLKLLERLRGLGYVK